MILAFLLFTYNISGTSRNFVFVSIVNFKSLILSNSNAIVYKLTYFMAIFSFCTPWKY